MLPYVDISPEYNWTHILIQWQNEYAQILSKRLGQAKAAHEEARKRRASSMRH
jgi:hypothetical protein